MFDYQHEKIVENFFIFPKTQRAQTTTNRALAIELPPTIQEIGTKTPPTIQKRASKIATYYYWSLKDNHQPKFKIKKKNYMGKTTQPRNTFSNLDWKLK